MTNTPDGDRSAIVTRVGTDHRRSLDGRLAGRILGEPRFEVVAAAWTQTFGAV